jgi:hypothetical protein
MTEEKEAELRSDVRNRLANYLLYETRRIVDDLFPDHTRAFWRGVLPRERFDVVFQELHRISVRVMNPATVFTDEQIDDRLIEEELKEKT